MGGLDIEPKIRGCVERMAHADGSLKVARNLAVGGDPIGAARAILRRPSPVIFCDVKMTAVGIKAKTVCLIEDKRVRADAERLGITRSRAAVRHWLPRMPNSLVVLGNAPTALDEILNLLASGEGEAPGAIFALCCGFVGAAAAKRRLIAEAPCPYLTVRGRGGGSAMAAAAINSILLD